jgi:hypothetical protein
MTKFKRLKYQCCLEFGATGAVRPGDGSIKSYIHFGEQFAIYKTHPMAKFLLLQIYLRNKYS